MSQMSEVASSSSSLHLFNALEEEEQQTRSWPWLISCYDAVSLSLVEAETLSSLSTSRYSLLSGARVSR